MSFFTPLESMQVGMILYIDIIKLYTTTAAAAAAVSALKVKTKWEASIAKLRRPIKGV